MGGGGGGGLHSLALIRGRFVCIIRVDLLL
jgi:hypothetical protein